MDVVFLYAFRTSGNIHCYGAAQPDILEIIKKISWNIC